MGTVTVNEVRRGAYHDSVALMRVARSMTELPGIAEAALMMGTPANRALMRDAQVLAAEGESAGPNDLVIAVRAESDAAAAAALAEAGRLLDRPKTQAADAVWRPKTLRQAVRSSPDATLALISVPGEYAVAEARKAIRRGLHAMIFSDNVALEAERSLKEEARALGRLVMGPDCGTSIIGGTPLAFANAVPRGPVGIVGASGTGIQEVSCLIANHGGGVSHAIGVGGRDLSSEVGGISTLMAMDMLEADAATRHVVLISKPPSDDVARRVAARISASARPYTVCFLGAPETALPANATAVPTLKAAAERALGRAFPRPENAAVLLPADRRRVAGLYSGGTLCAEAQVVFRAAGETVASNAPVPGAHRLGASIDAHRLVDLGDDAFTRGRPHPMIDPAVRDDALDAALNDPAVGAVLIDIVIGHGAHADPAGHLAGVLAGVGAPRPRVVVASVTGTDADPQDRRAQAAALAAAGVVVLPSNADAAGFALACIGAPR